MERRVLYGITIIVILVVGISVILFWSEFPTPQLNETTTVTTPTTIVTTTTTTTDETTTTTTDETTTTPLSFVDIITMRGYIVAGTSSGWPPYEMINSTTQLLEGFDIDLTEMIADYLNVTVAWQDMDFDALVSSCTVGTIDLIAAAMYLTPERSEVLLPSIPYLYANNCVIVPSDSLLEIQNLTELDGYDVGVLSSSTADDELTYLVDEGYSISLHRYPDPAVLFADLDASVIDAIYIEFPYFQVYSGLYNVTNLLCTDDHPVVIYCRQGDTSLQEVIDLVISAADGDGRLEALIMKWFS